MQDPAERGKVEDVLQALPVRLEDDRERAVLPRHLEQALRLEPLLPQRRALPGPPPGNQERASGVLAEPRAEERRRADLLHDEILELLRLDEEIGERGRRICVGEVERDPVVRPERLHLGAERVAQPGRQRHRPRRVDAPAERRQDADPPVADLVAEPLDDDGAVGRQRAELRSCSRRNARRFLLASSSRWYSLASRLVALLVGERSQLARRLADPLPELVRPPHALALPERHRAGHAGRRRDEHAVARDLLDPPGRRAEHERLPLARLVDHLLVELADAAAAVDLEDAEEPAVGDRAGVRHGEPARAGAAADHAGRAIPDDARPQLGELVRGVAAREHVEHVLELLAGQVGERVGAADEAVQVVDRDLLLGADRDDLLGEDVERVPRDRRLLDRALAHRLRDDGALEQVGAELREDPPLRRRAELVAGPADPLEAARHRLRALDLDDEVDGAHVDPELEARRGDEAGDPAGLQVLLDQHPLLARERAVVGARDLLPRRAR